MTPELLEEVGAATCELEEVDIAIRTTRAARLAILDREDDDGPLAGTGHAGGDDALYPLMPTFAGDHDDGIVAMRMGKLLLDLGVELDFRLTSLLVDLLELAGDTLGAIEIVAHQQVIAYARVAHATRRVETRNEREGQPRRGDGVDFDPADGRQGEQPDARVVAHVRKAVCHQGAILAHERHEVGDGAERGEIGEIEPKVWLAQRGTEHAEELEGDTRTGEITRRARGVELWVGNGNVDGNGLARLVMVGDADLDAAREKAFDLVRAGYAAIDGHDEVRMACHATLDRGLRQGVSLIVAMRDEPMRIGAKRTQGTHREGRGRNAVNVEVAKDEDALPALDGGS